MFLSPLELLRTRLIVQPSSDGKSKSSIGLLKDAIAEEGGVSGLFANPQLLVPALLEHTLRPIFTLSIPLIIERKFGITPDSSPVTYSMLDLSLGLASLLIILPIETVRKRLQLQDRMSETEVWQRGGKREKRKSIVRIRKRAYRGVLDVIWTIMSEKRRSKQRRGSRTEQDTAADEYKKQRAAFDGIKQLYRGVSLSVLR
jgi:fusion and transport protein UGO1